MAAGVTVKLIHSELKKYQLMRHFNRSARERIDLNKNVEDEEFIKMLEQWEQFYNKQGKTL